jgi:uroporphyrin-III C-methyltransferase/precorrin-2 dehydrogenase/sirohydrochlorin ferrochelatase
MNIVSSPQNRVSPADKASRKPQLKAPQRMADLASLPVFFTLNGKRAIVAGGSNAAAWKAELLAASGAEVHVFAQDLDPAFAALLESAGATRVIIHHTRLWAHEDFKAAAIAVADAADDGEALAFFEAACAAGVPVNVIDRPDFCQFRFGSIVNRSPVVIAISTDGAAPVLGQAIRRRIETLIPPALAEWAGLAKQLRGRVMARLAPGPQRRAFWERLAGRAFAASPDESSAEELIADIDRIATGTRPKEGRVTLVGAGPGDAELLTLQAVRALQAADIILFDDLVSDEVLELARREAKRMLVGKRGGRKSCRQDDINDMMVSLARAGKQVVRLKSGDPMIFGRAGEELARLDAEGIAVSVVPGITAASAMASRLGVSLTHRDCAQSVRFVTGHSRKGALPADINWSAIADPTTTTIFYMGGRTAGQIADTLIGQGLSQDTPVVVCCSVSRPGQRQWRGVLRDLHSGMASIGFDDPVLIGIGPVFSQGRSVNGASIRHQVMSSGGEAIMRVG